MKHKEASGVPKAQPTEEALYLFSSNIRPLYAQDILNVLAAPSGISYTFRYERRYVVESLASTWNETLVGRKALIHFSLQQHARYHDPVFFPIRIGWVHQAQRLGEDIYLLEFVLDRIISLEAPGTEGDDHRFAKPAADYTDHIRGLLGDENVPYRAAIGAGPDVTQNAGAPVDASSDEIHLFDRNTKYLWRTDAFRDAWFTHILGISQRSDQPLDEVRTSRLKKDERLFSLTGSTTYHLHVLQRQPREVAQEATFAVATDEQVIRVIGRKGFTIGSRYDRILVPLHAIEPPDGEPRHTVVTIEPQGAQGPRVTIPVRVTPSPGQAQMAVGTGVALLLVGLLSLRPEAPSWEKLLFLGAALFSHLFSRTRTLITAWRERRPSRASPARTR